MRCPISFIPLSELEHPVVFRNQKVLVVYDAEHLITWLQTSRRNPTTNETLNPFTPLRELLLPYRLQHTTDAQFEKTCRLLLDKGSYAKTLLCLWINTTQRLISLLDVAITPLIMSLSVLIAVGAATIMPEIALRLIELNRLACAERHWSVYMLEEFMKEIIEAHNAAMLGVNLLYIRFVHPLATAIIHVYVGSDCVTRWWCEGLALLKASPLMQNATTTQLTAMDVLLLACK